MKKLIFTLLICGSTYSIFAQSETKIKKIKQMLELNGSANVSMQVIKTMLTQFEKLYPKVDKEVWEEFAKEIKAEDLIALIIPVYDKYYTEEDIDQLIVFYNSPIGKKVTETLPAISQESMVAGQAWGKQLAEKVIAKLKDKGYN
jgi:hypothetical protein